MRARIFLANSAEVREGLLFILGAGWNQIGPSPSPFAIAGIIEGEWEEANRKFTVEFVIEDDDGAPLMVPGFPDPMPFKLTTALEFGRPPGVVQGTTFNIPVAMAIPPIPLEPGRGYVLLVRINGEERDRVRFIVRPAVVAQGPPAP